MMHWQEEASETGSQMAVVAMNSPQAPPRAQNNRKSSQRAPSREQMDALRAVMPGYTNLLKKKKIRRKGGSHLEEYVPNKREMQRLQHNQVLSNHDKELLKETQLRYQMIQYIPKEESDGESNAESVDSLDENDTINDQTERHQGLVVKHSPAVKPDVNTDLDPQLIMDIVKKVEGQDVEKRDVKNGKKFEVKKRVTVKEMMEGLKRKQWVYMKHLLAFLKHRGPFVYNSFPGFYDELSKAIVFMNQESVDGLVEVYNLCTIFLHRDFPGEYGIYSKFRTDSDQHIFQHGRGCPLKERYNPYDTGMQKWLRTEPEGIYTNEAHLASFQMPLNISYGSEESLRFLKSLEQCKNHDVFKVPVVQGYLNYKWDQSKQFLLGEAVLHALFLISFNVFAINEDARKNTAAKVVVLFFCSIFSMREVLQIMGRKCSYFSDPFNYPDIGTIICCTLSVFVSGTSYESSIVLQWPIMLGILLLFTRALSYFRLWGRTRHLIRSITETFYDMVPFVIIMIVLTFAYASAYLSCFEPAEFKDHDYTYRLFRGYELLLGGYEDPENGPHYLMFLALSIVALIVLLNMLIAIMGDTFGRVQSNTVVYDYRERLSVNIDLESLIYVCARNRRRLYHIGILRRPGGFDMEEESFSTQNKLLRRLIKENMKNIQEAKEQIGEVKTMLQNK